MIMALLALLLLAIIGSAFMMMNTSENAANGNYKDSQKAYFASRAGLENVRALIRQNPDSPLKTQISALPMPLAVAGVATPTGVLYALNKDASGATPDFTKTQYQDDELCQEQFGALGLAPALAGAPCSGASVPVTYPPAALGATDIAASGTASALPLQWVRITNKQNWMGTMGKPVVPGQPNGTQVCFDGLQEYLISGPTCPLSNSPTTKMPMTPVWLLTSLAVTPGGSRRMTQMEVAFTPPLVIPSPITVDATLSMIGSYIITSYDNCSCVQHTIAGVTTWGPAPGAAACYSSAPAAITSGGVGMSGGAGVVFSSLGTTMLTASVQVNPFPFPTDQYINTFKQIAQNASTTKPWDYNCTGTPNLTSTPPTFASCGTQTNQAFGTYPPNIIATNGADASGAVPATVYVPGSLQLTSNATGAGVLIVDGDLDIHGGLNFYGLLLVRGKVKFTGGGSSQVNIFGGILAGDQVDAADIDVIGGHFHITYDRCALNNSAPPGPPKLLASHELIY
jgi:hypothetical protein